MDLESMDDVVRFVIATSAVVAVSVLAVLAVIVLFKIVTGRIDISGILSASQDASLSRFQFMIFTFTIAFCYLMIMLYQRVHACDVGAIKAACNVSGIKLPDGNGAAVLLGISGGSYALGKGIQVSGDTSTTNAAARAAAEAAGKAAASAQGPATAAAVVTPAGGGPGAQAAVGVDSGES
jgi:hypothetical protein